MGVEEYVNTLKELINISIKNYESVISHDWKDYGEVPGCLRIDYVENVDNYEDPIFKYDIVKSYKYDNNGLVSQDISEKYEISFNGRFRKVAHAIILIDTEKNIAILNMFFSPTFGFGYSYNINDNHSVSNEKFLWMM